MTKSEYIAQHRSRLRAEHGMDRPRYCTQCKCQRPRNGGREIAFNGGRNARWVCGMHKGEQ